MLNKEGVETTVGDKQPTHSPIDHRRVHCGFRAGNETHPGRAERRAPLRRRFFNPAGSSCRWGAFSYLPTPRLCPSFYPVCLPQEHAVTCTTVCQLKGWFRQRCPLPTLHFALSHLENESVVGIIDLSPQLSGTHLRQRKACQETGWFGSPIAPALRGAVCERRRCLTNGVNQSFSPPASWQRAPGRRHRQ